MHEWHPDGLPVRHRTIHVLRALRPGVRTYTYRFDSREATVRAIRGRGPVAIGAHLVSFRRHLERRGESPGRYDSVIKL